MTAGVAETMRCEDDTVSLDLDTLAFETERLRCGPWVDDAHRSGADLAAIVADLLTPATTAALPSDWQGDFDVERAQAWIEQREADSTILLVSDTESSEPIGLVILASVPTGDTEPADDASPVEDAALADDRVDLRIGYVIDEAWWGRGIATELVAGLVDRARTDPDIVSVTAGVDPGHGASIRVLERTGFRLVDHDDESSTYRVDVGTEWDAYASGWDDDPIARAYATAAFASLERLLQRDASTLDDALVLDFGCGTGLLTEQLAGAGANVHAVDTSAAMLGILRSKQDLLGAGHVIADTDLPPPEQRFRVAACSSVCAFLDDYPATVVDLAARLQPDGLFVQWDWERTADDEHGLTRDQIVAALRAAGLTDIEVSIGFDIEIDGQRMAPLMGHGRRPSTPASAPATELPGSGTAR